MLEALNIQGFDNQIFKLQAFMMSKWYDCCRVYQLSPVSQVR